jgi:hypothetical protein
VRTVRKTAKAYSNLADTLDGKVGVTTNKLKRKVLSLSLCLSPSCVYVCQCVWHGIRINACMIHASSMYTCVYVFAFALCFFIWKCPFASYDLPRGDVRTRRESPMREVLSLSLCFSPSCVYVCQCVYSYKRMHDSCKQHVYMRVPCLRLLWVFLFGSVFLRLTTFLAVMFFLGGSLLCAKVRVCGACSAEQYSVFGPGKSAGPPVCPS